MLKKEEKKKEEKFSIEKITHPDGDSKLEYHEFRYRMNSEKGQLDVTVNIRTSSCGSIQFSYMHSYDNILPKFTKKEKQMFLDTITSHHSDINHFFFIDKEGGLLEHFFKDLGFEEVWSYLNYNSENTVKMWCWNRWTDDEVYDKLSEEDEW